MDAEIALEMAMERERKLSTASNNSSMGGTYVGPCPHSPGQVERTCDMLFIVKQYVLQQAVLLHYSTDTVRARLCGLCLPPQEEEVQYEDQDLLSSRKMSVSRMHSLPNDSYMFRPVRPASAPYPLEEVELSPQHQHSGNLS